MARPKVSPIAPHSPTAEKHMLGACLLSRSARDILVKDLAPADFYSPANAAIADAVAAMHAVGADVDPATVANWIVERTGRDGLDAVGGLGGLIEYQVDCPSTGSARTYAATIADRAARRNYQTCLHAALDAAADLAVDATELVEATIARLGRLHTPRPGLHVRDVAEFLDRDLQYRWLVKDLLERGDRVIITAAEGGGKSVILRQLAVQFAAGVHPWRRERTDPIRALLIDLENSEMLMQRWLTRLVAVVARDHQALRLGDDPGPAFDPDRLRVECRPRGVDLLTHADRRWFTDLVQAARPDVILTGPIYKLHTGDITDDGPTKTLTAYLDNLRDAFDCAIILEAHSPHGMDGGRQRTLRPKGSQLWMAWPEFGYGIRRRDDDPGYDFHPWRPPRDDNRTWPTRIRHGQGWPWVNEYLPAADDPPF